MKKAGVWILVLLGLTLGSCSLFKKSIPPYPRGVIFPVKEDLGVDYEGELVDQAVQDGESLFLGTTKGLVYAVDLVSRQVVWSYKAGGPLVCAPAPDEDCVFICDENSQVSCLEKTDGRLRWAREFKEGGAVSLVSGEDRAFLATSGGDLLALAGGDGQEIWRFRAGAAVSIPPVLWKSRGGSQLFLFSEDCLLHLLTPEGRSLEDIYLGKELSAPPLVEPGFIFFGGEDRTVQRFDLAARKTQWKVSLGATLAATPLTLDSRIFIWTTHGVLMCLDKSGGDVLWWKSLASRLTYPPVIIEDKIIASVSSPTLAGFMIKTGEDGGTFDTGRELKGPVSWVEPWLLVNAYDPAAEKGRLLFLKKEVSLSLKASKEEPQKPGEEVIFVAKASGFFMPKFEFVLGAGNQEETVQKPSLKNFWSWYPDKAGEFTVKVRVADAKEKAEAETTYKIVPEAEDKPPAKKKTAEAKVKKKGERP